MAAKHQQGSNWGIEAAKYKKLKTYHVSFFLSLFSVISM